jgi:phasin
MHAMIQNPAINQFTESAEQATKVIGNSCSTAAEGLKDYHSKVLEIAQINTNAAFDYAQRIMDVKSLSEAVELSTSHAQKQFEAMTEQVKELAALGQKIAAKTTEPLTSGAKKNVH